MPLIDEQMVAMFEYVRTALHGSRAHGFDHTERVVRLCEMVGAREGADMRILIPAALFHDIARPLEEETGAPHEGEGARYPEDHIPGTVHVIHAHRYSSGVAPETLEAWVLSDSDNLDAMGAMGIARTFMQAAIDRRVGVREIQRSSNGISDATVHIREKLLTLRDLMYTESARSIAERRHAFLVTFLETLDNEISIYLNPSGAVIAGDASRR